MAGNISAYNQIVEALKEKIRLRRFGAVLSANIQLLALYWEIWNIIAVQEVISGWGSKIVDQLARDLRATFRGFSGLSPRNLRYMRDFATAWPELAILQQDAAILDTSSILQQAVAKLPWGHNCLILDKIKEREERVFYAQLTLENNWSRAELARQIESHLYRRKGKLAHNFTTTLPDGHSQLAADLFKDPYNLGFLQLTANAKEKDLENALVSKMSEFMVEMGIGFSFVAQQVPFQKEGKEYVIDLLLYHTKLHCYVAVELKWGDFKVEYTGKMNVYFSLVDEYRKSSGDLPSIGLILCKNKSHSTAEYALRDIQKPMGVAGYEVTFTKTVPENLKASLPAVELIEKEMEKEPEKKGKPVTEKIAQLKDYINKLGKPEMQVFEKEKVKSDLFYDTLEILSNKIETIITEVMQLFQQAQIVRVYNGRILGQKDIREFQQAMDNNSVYSIGLNASFRGFKYGGTNVFSENFTLTFSLDSFKYWIGPENPRRDTYKEKRYDETLTDVELDEIAERWSEMMIGIINESAQRTT